MKKKIKNLEKNIIFLLNFKNKSKILNKIAKFQKKNFKIFYNFFCLLKFKKREKKISLSKIEFFPNKFFKYFFNSFLILKDFDLIFCQNLSFVLIDLFPFFKTLFP